MFKLITHITIFAGLISHVCLANADEIDQAITTIKSVEKFGKGNVAAMTAMETLNQAKPEDVPRLFNALNGANPLAKNWLRSAIESALDKSPAKPGEFLKQYLNNNRNDAVARLFAFEILTADNIEYKTKLIPTFIDDPSLPLRRLAVAQRIEQGKKMEQDEEAVRFLKDTLQFARDVDQVKSIADHLATLNSEIDLPRQLGFIMTWNLIGTYSNAEEKGFATEYEPEKLLTTPMVENTSIELEKSFAGKKVQTHTTEESTGIVDLNAIFGNEKSSVVYATTLFSSADDRDVDVRIGCINAQKVWVNDKLVIDNEIYHVGMQPDQYSGKARLNKGKNRIVVKVCQNDDKAPWAQNWMFQLRVCDETGKAVLSSDRQ